MDTTQLVLDTAQRMFADHCDKALLDRAEQGHYAANLWDVVAENGLPMLATSAGGGTLADALRLLRVAGRHALPVPLAEALIANHLMGATECGAFAGRLSLGIADSHSAEGGEVNVALVGVPWARSMERICYVIGDPLEVVILDVSECEITEHANIAGEARDDVRFLGVPGRCGAPAGIDVTRVFEWMALSRAALMSGALERVLELSLGYAKERKQFGRPIGNFQAIQHNLALLAGQVAAALRATDAAIAALDTARFPIQVAVAKARVGEAASTRANRQRSSATEITASNWRSVRLVRRHGIDLAGEDDATDPLALDSPALAQLRGASVVGRVATGPRAGQRVLRLGADPNAPRVTSGGPRHAHSVGFDLHANVAVHAGERLRLEQLCRYVLRPPLAQEALELTAGGKVLLRLRRPWRDGTQAIRFEPSELLERLAAMIPRPRSNLLIYHGAFAPRGCRRVAAALAEGEREGLTAWFDHCNYSNRFRARSD